MRPTQMHNKYHNPITTRPIWTRSVFTKKCLPKMHWGITQKRTKRHRKVRNNLQKTHTTYTSQTRRDKGHTKNQIP